MMQKAFLKESGQKRSKYTKSTRTARKLIKWIRKTEFAKRFPYTPGQLSEMQVNDLRTIASLCMGYTVGEYRHFKKQDYISFILARQAPIVDAGPCPVRCVPDMD